MPEPRRPLASRPRGEVRSIALALARRPGLWPTAVGAAAAHLPARWWRGRWGRVGPWLAFRLETAYGAEGGPIEPSDLITWLEWVRDWRRRGS